MKQHFNTCLKAFVLLYIEGCVVSSQRKSVSKEMPMGSDTALKARATRFEARTRLRKACGLVAVLAGSLVLAAITGLNLGVVPPLPTKFALGVSIPIFYGSALGACVLSWRQPRGAWAPVAKGDLQRAPEEGSTITRQHRRLVALGVPEEAALVLAGHPFFSINELERLLGKGCPVDIALRILWPDY